MLTRLEEMFWSRVDVKDKDSCWNWLGPTTGSGYGHFWIGGRSTGKDIQVHRLSWELYNKIDIPKGLWVLHKCDNRRCVNPNHLSLGTSGMNQRDRFERNPTIRGGRVSSISVNDIEKIKQLHKDGMSVRKIAPLFSKSPAYISLLINNKRDENANTSASRPNS